MKHPKDTLNGITLEKREWIALLACLQKLLKDVLAGVPLRLSYDGICRNWWREMKRAGWKDNVAHRAFAIVLITGQRWKHSVSPGVENAFPVPRVPIDGHVSDRHLWLGPNRDLRIDLMRYTIKRLRDKIRRMK